MAKDYVLSLPRLTWCWLPELWSSYLLEYKFLPKHPLTLQHIYFDQSNCGILFFEKKPIKYNLSGRFLFCHVFSLKDFFFMQCMFIMFVASTNFSQILPIFLSTQLPLLSLSPWLSLSFLVSNEKEQNLWTKIKYRKLK